MAAAEDRRHGRFRAPPSAPTMDSPARTPGGRRRRGRRRRNRRQLRLRRANDGVRIVSVTDATVVAEPELPEGWHQLLLDGPTARRHDEWSGSADTIVSPVRRVRPEQPDAAAPHPPRGSTVATRSIDGVADSSSPHSSTSGCRSSSRTSSGSTRNRRSNATRRSSRSRACRTGSRVVRRGRRRQLRTDVADSRLRDVATPADFSGLGLTWIASIDANGDGAPSVRRHRLDGRHRYTSTDNLYIATPELEMRSGGQVPVPMSTMSASLPAVGAGAGAASGVPEPATTEVETSDPDSTTTPPETTETDRHDEAGHQSGHQPPTRRRDVPRSRRSTRPRRSRPRSRTATDADPPVLAGRRHRRDLRRLGRGRGPPAQPVRDKRVQRRPASRHDHRATGATSATRASRRLRAPARTAPTSSRSPRSAASARTSRSTPCGSSRTRATWSRSVRSNRSTSSICPTGEPSLEGELKIPGYSAYLHPVGDGLLLGVGQDTTDEGRHRHPTQPVRRQRSANPSDQHAPDRRAQRRRVGPQGVPLLEPRTAQSSSRCRRVGTTAARRRLPRQGDHRRRRRRRRRRTQRARLVVPRRDHPRRGERQGLLESAAAVVAIGDELATVGLDQAQFSGPQRLGAPQRRQLGHPRGLRLLLVPSNDPSDVSGTCIHDP